MRLGFCVFHGARVKAASRREICCSLTQECVQRSLLVLSGYAATTGIKAEKTRTESYF